MAKLLWDKKFETGNAVVDGQHQQLFKLLSDLDQAIEDQKGASLIDQTLGRFALYVIDHFRDEEKLMKNCGYPYFDEHKAIHDKLTLKASELLDKYREGDKQLAQFLSNFMRDWIMNHIMCEDQKIFDWIRQQSA